ncbi:MAG TPA: hypothetical protein VMV49_08615 [Candidatus Deferrimicrobium sp.]|nr:hypothetical protein [Candidatus Deferrimicrobium sp.]
MGELYNPFEIIDELKGDLKAALFEEYYSQKTKWEKLNVFYVPLITDTDGNDIILKDIIEFRNKIYYGVKGSGKTFYFLKAMSELQKNKKNIVIYIDLKQICLGRIFADIESTLFVFFFAFLKKLINALEEVKVGFFKEKKKEQIIKEMEAKTSAFFEIFKFDKPDLKEMDAEKMKKYFFKINQEAKNHIKNFTTERIEEEIQKIMIYICELIKYLLNELKFEAIILFLDEFSDIYPLDKKLTIRVQEILQKFVLEDFFNLNFKEHLNFFVNIGAYPEDYIFSAQLRRIGVGEQFLDLSYHVEESIRYDHHLFREAYILRTILQKRIDYYNTKYNRHIELEDFFDYEGNEQEFYQTFFLSSFNVIRNIGYILEFATDPGEKWAVNQRIKTEDLLKYSIKFYEQSLRTLSTGIQQSLIPINDEAWPRIVSRMVVLANDPSFSKENIGVFNLTVDCPDEVKRDIYTLLNHFLVHKLFIRQGRPNLEIYRINQGFLTLNQYGGKYNLAIHRTKNFNINKILDVKTIICENGHEMNIDTLRDFFKTNDSTKWFCGICQGKFEVTEQLFDGQTLKHETQKIRRFGKKQLKQLETIRNILERSKIFPEEEIILIISRLVEGNCILTANEISARLNKDGIELTPHQISTYLKRRKLRKFIRIAQKHPNAYTLAEDFLRLCS